MKLEWIIDSNDAAKVRALVQHFEGDPLVVERRERNLDKQRPALTTERIWQVLVGCLLTTQQKSGPGRPVDRFVHATPFPLAYEACRQAPNLESLVHAEVSGFGGIRRSLTIAREVAENFRRLEQGQWPHLLDLVARTDMSDDHQMERSAAHWVDEALRGFGPKQARNLLQWLGVTKYEIPIDSRVTKWLNRELLSFRLSAVLLSDSSYYDMVSDGVFALCETAGVLPCIFDAAVFASFDRRAPGAVGAAAAPN